ncbi:hypothetical protein GAH_00895 [Geoglobus ahangari]|uniref:Uncharacterized protein n=1 Tax=Geoglobus ahangari TaxID=113653 RepID=A0A0F7IE52_9EURY|nr:hypothetical protein [Geoglobus ahangari]AKG91777.1 hypothetical protein GAH_00895 [Geoglobus ahangari]
MGLFDKLRNVKDAVGEAIESAAAYAKADDFLIERIDEMLSKSWEKVRERRPVTVAGISLESESEYNFVYRAECGLVHVEMEHEFPFLEIEMRRGMKKLEKRLKVADFVEVQGKDFMLKNRETLESILAEMMRAICS